jgi:hypothetical protein
MMGLRKEPSGRRFVELEVEVEVCVEQISFAPRLDGLAL